MDTNFDQKNSINNNDQTGSPNNRLGDGIFNRESDNNLNLGLGNENSFISLSQASKETGYHQDYLGFLCRQGKLKGFKIGRNWTTTRQALNDFLDTYKNNLLEVVDETGHKIPVHVEKSPSFEQFQSGYKTQGTMPATIYQATVPSMLDRDFEAHSPILSQLKTLKKEVLENVEKRIRLLDENLTDLEKKLVAQKLVQKQIEPLKVQEEPERLQQNLIPGLPVQGLKNQFTSNFEVADNRLISPTAELSIPTSEFLTKDKVKQLFASFKKPNYSIRYASAIASIIAIAGLFGLLLLNSWLNSAQLPSSIFVYLKTNKQSIESKKGEEQPIKPEKKDQTGPTIVIRERLRTESIVKTLPPDINLLSQLIDQRLNKYLAKGKLGIGQLQTINGTAAPGLLMKDASNNLGAISYWQNQLAFYNKTGPGNVAAPDLRMVIDSAGRVGINSSTPIATLAVQGIIGTINPFVVTSSTGLALLTVTPASNVGIGTTTPTHTLEVYRDASASDYTYIFAKNASSNQAAALIAENDTGQQAELVVYGSTKTGDIAGIPAASLARWDANTKIMIGNTTNNDLYFTTNNLIRATFSGSGNLGIGTTLPTSTLFIQGTSTTPLLTIASSSGAVLLTVTSDGNVGIGTTTPAQTFVVVGNGQFTAVGSAASANDLRITAEGILTTNTSDISMKTNLKALNGSEILQKVMKLQAYTYNWINSPSEAGNPEGVKDYGMIAQEVVNVFPEITFTNKVDGKMGINYSRLPTILTAAVQEQQWLIQPLVDHIIIATSTGNVSLLAATSSAEIILSNVAKGTQISVATSTAALLISQNTDLSSVINLLQMQANGQDRFLVTTSGLVSILANTSTGTDVVLTVRNFTTTLFAISAVGDIQTLGHITAGKDTAGAATIKAGDNQTTVTFDRPYLDVPKVVVSVNGLPDFFYGVATKTLESFTITTSKPVATDTTFDWMALAQPEEVKSKSSSNLEVIAQPISNAEEIRLEIPSSQPPALDQPSQDIITSISPDSSTSSTDSSVPTPADASSMSTEPVPPAALLSEPASTTPSVSDAGNNHLNP